MKQLNVITLYIFATFIIAYCVAGNNDEEAMDPELNVDRTRWKDPYDPLGNFGFQNTGSCDVDEAIQALKEVSKIFNLFLESIIYI